MQSRPATDFVGWEIEFLPALPSNWPAGNVTGLRAMGGTEVDLRWDAGKLTGAELRPEHAGTWTISVGTLSKTHTLLAGEKYQLGPQLELLSAE